MKRIFALLMAFLMVFGLCSCSGEEKFAPSRGTVENGAYSNSVFGISFASDENWYYYSDEEVAVAMGVAAEEIPSADDKKALAEAGIIYDVYCASTLTGSTLNISYENLTATYGEVIDVEYYLELYQMEIDSMLNSGNVSITKNEREVASIGEGLYPCLSVEADLGGLKIYEKIIIKKCGDWLGVVTAAALDEAELASVLKKITF